MTPNGADAADRLHRAQESFAKGDLTHARREAEMLHAQNPIDLSAAILLANCYIKLGRASEALNILRPLEAGNENNIELEYSLAFAMFQVEGSSEALDRMEKVAKTTQSAQTWMAAGAGRMGREEFRQAKADLDQAYALNPMEPGIKTMEGVVRFALLDPDGAFPYFQAALRDNPRDFQANLYDGMYRMQKGEYDAARPLLELALELEPRSPLARLKMAQLNAMTGNTAVAISELEKLEKETPKWLDPHVQLASLYYKVHRPEDGARERQIVQQIQEATEKAGPANR